jgi:hypothetical protein
MRQRTYPQLFTFNEKYGDRYIMVHSPEGEEKMFLKILKERNQEGWYYWMKDYKDDKIKSDWNKIQNAIQENDGKLARHLIDAFRNNEYEGYERVDFENIM